MAAMRSTPGSFDHLCPKAVELKRPSDYTVAQTSADESKVTTMGHFLGRVRQSNLDRSIRFSATPSFTFQREPILLSWWRAIDPGKVCRHEPDEQGD